MVKSKQSVKEQRLVQSEEITKIIERLHARFGKYAVPVAELRKQLDEEMGEKTMTGELFRMREER